MVDLDAARKRLNQELEEVLPQHERISAHLRNEDRELPIDWSDMAQFMENDEVLEALEDRTRDRVNAIVRSLVHIEQGTYAKCSRCGATISDERLDLLPTAIVCADCA